MKIEPLLAYLKGKNLINLNHIENADSTLTTYIKVHPLGSEASNEHIVTFQKNNAVGNEWGYKIVIKKYECICLMMIYLGNGENLALTFAGEIINDDTDHAIVNIEKYIFRIHQKAV